MSIKAHAQRLALDPAITLYDIDATDLGGPVFRITPMSNVLGAGGQLVLTEDVDLLGAARLDMPSPLGNGFVYIKLVFEKAGVGRTFQLRAGELNDSLRVTVDANDPAASPSPPIVLVGAAYNTGAEVYVDEVDATYGVVVFKVVAESYLTAFELALTGDYAAGDQLKVVEASLYYADEFDHYVSKASDISGLQAWYSTGGIGLAVEFTAAPQTTVKWRGEEYTPTPVEAQGFEQSSSGQLPRPKFTVSNVFGWGTQITNQYRNLEGAVVTRWRTFKRFLDDGLTPDPNSHLPKEIYVVDRKATHLRTEIEWELASVLDQQGSMLPARQIIRSGCQLLYRRYTVSAFDYEHTTCPYAGTDYFTDNDTPTLDPTQDKCSQQLTGCLARFPTGDVPFGGFPSVGRIRR